MNSIVKLALAFAGGVAVGSGATYLVTKKRFQKKNDGILDEAVNKIEMAYMGKLDKANDRIKDLNARLDEYEKEEYERLVNPNRYRRADNGEGDGIPDIPPVEKEREDETIYEITLEDFMNDALFDKGYLTYYRGDNILSTESDDMVEDPGYTLGEIGKHLDDVNEEVIYIRNSRVGCDYQIDFSDGSYREEVLGSED